MDLRFKYGNFLLVDGEFLQVGDPEQLREVLTQAADMIGEKALVAVMRLAGGKDRVHRKVLVHEMVFNPDESFNPASGSGVYRNRCDLKPKFHVYWDIAEQAGYQPEVRMMSGADEELDGAVLFVSHKGPR